MRFELFAGILTNMDHVQQIWMHDDSTNIKKDYDAEKEAVVTHLSNDPYWIVISLTSGGKNQLKYANKAERDKKFKVLTKGLGAVE